jgi:hypothetical protein
VSIEQGISSRFDFQDLAEELLQSEEVLDRFIRAAEAKGVELDEDFDEYAMDSIRVSVGTIAIDVFGLDDWDFFYELLLEFDEGGSS